MAFACPQDIVMCVYTEGYRPRLVPVSLILPSLDMKATTAFGNVTATAAPAPAPLGQCHSTGPERARCLHGAPLPHLSNLTGRVTGANLALPGYSMGNASASHALKVMSKFHVLTMSHAFLAALEAVRDTGLPRLADLAPKHCCIPTCSFCGDSSDLTCCRASRR